MKQVFLAVAAMAVITWALAGEGRAATLEARVSISRQEMTVTHRGRVLHRWPVSTARKGYVTPRGRWRPTRMHRMWHSRKYDMAPMPHSIFYYRGYAIHGTDAVGKLGRPSSHGCVRLHPDNAARLFSLVRQVGPAATRIVVVD